MLEEHHSKIKIKDEMKKKRNNDIKRNKFLSIDINKLISELKND